MFEPAEIGHNTGKAAFREPASLLRAALLEAQVDRYADKKIPVLLLISGQDGAGKGETINVLYEWMNPRFMDTVAFSEPIDEGRERAPMWRCWRQLPPKGRIGMRADFWYSDPIRERIHGDMSLKHLDARAEQINRFETMSASWPAGRAAWPN